MILDALKALGLDSEELDWRLLSLCATMDTELFFDEYESDEQVARAVDEACSSCPVRKQCLLSGVENDEWGVWGGVFLTSGKPDKNKNSHKDDNAWEEIRQVLNG